MRNIYLKTVALCMILLFFAGGAAMAQQKITVKEGSPMHSRTREFPV